MNGANRLLRRSWFLGMVLISVGAHALLMPLPIPNKPPEAIAEDEQTVAKDVPAVTVEAIPLRSLPASPQKSPPQRSLPPQTANRQAPPNRALSAAAPPVPQPQPEQLVQQPVQQQPEQSINPQPEAPVSDPLPPDPVSPDPVSPDPVSPESPEQEEDVNAGPLQSEYEQGKLVVLADDFPHLANAQSGCFGLSNCLRVPSQGSYRKDAEALVKQMEDSGYQVQPDETIDEPGHRVYVVEKLSEPDKTYFLNVFSDSGSMLYTLSSEIMSLTELQQLAS